MYRHHIVVDGYLLTIDYSKPQLAAIYGGLFVSTVIHRHSLLDPEGRIVEVVLLRRPTPNPAHP